MHVHITLVHTRVMTIKQLGLAVGSVIFGSAYCQRTLILVCSPPNCLLMFRTPETQGKGWVVSMCDQPSANSRLAWAFAGSTPAASTILRPGGLRLAFQIKQPPIFGLREPCLPKRAKAARRSFSEGGLSGVGPFVVRPTYLRLAPQMERSYLVELTRFCWYKPRRTVVSLMKYVYLIQSVRTDAM
jgi:hypothetical protein